MSRADNTHYLAEAAAERGRSTRRRATEAIEHLDRCGEAVTFSSVAATAGVSRAWLYRQDDLRSAIISLRPTAGRPAPAAVANQRASMDSLRRRLEATRDEIAQLRAETPGCANRSPAPSASDGRGADLARCGASHGCPPGSGKPTRLRR